MKNWIIPVLCLVSIVGYSQTYHDVKEKTTVFTNANKHEVVEIEEFPRFSRSAKNVILLIGDGMGTAEIFAGLTANGGQLNMSMFPFTGFSKTQASDNFITDSAAGGTALATGSKTKNGAISLDEDGKVLKTILEIAEERGKATGLISTSSITHATPASFIAHQPNRNMYEEIAADFLNTDIDLFIGGGKDNFAKRKDGKNLLNNLKEKGYDVQVGMDKILASNSGKIAGFIADGHGPRVKQRSENMLQKSTKKALDVLSKNKKGFFLMVEGSQIDWGGHANDVSYITTEVLDFDKAVGEALKFALEDKNTLVVITADHETGGLTIIGGDMGAGKVEGKFTTKHHTGVMVPVFAIGPNAHWFSGIQENTEVFYKMLESFK